MPYPTNCYANQMSELLARVTYSDETQLSAEWEISDGVMLDPRIAMGHPVVRGTGVTTFVVSRSFQANDKDAGFVANMFGLSSQQVGDAVRFEEQLRSASIDSSQTRISLST